MMSYMKQNKKRKQTLESMLYGEEIIFNLKNFQKIRKRKRLQ